MDAVTQHPEPTVTQQLPDAVAQQLDALTQQMNAANSDQMDPVTQHQTWADIHLKISALAIQSGDYRTSAQALERAVSKAAAAVATHWNYFPDPTRRQIGHILLLMAYKRHISHTSARSFHKFPSIHQAAHLPTLAASRTDKPTDIPRTLRNTHRRVARIIAAAHRIIATDPEPTLCPYWENPTDPPDDQPEP